jgi:hypothetical protein
MDKRLGVSWKTSIIRMVGERLKSEAPEEYEKYIRLNNKEKVGYIRKNLDKLSFGHDRKLLKDLSTVLYPLLEEIRTEELYKETTENHVSRFYAAMHNIYEFRIILQRYRNSVIPRSLEEESRLSLLYYLMIVESIFTMNIDLLVYLLIKNNVKYYRIIGEGRKTKNLDNLKEISKETLYNKITFLKENGFSIISNVCDRNLRNSIAHMEFIVFEDGSVGYENKVCKKTIRIEKDELEARIERLLNVCECIILSIEQFYAEKYV